MFSKSPKYPIFRHSWILILNTAQNSSYHAKWVEERKQQIYLTLFTCTVYKRNTYINRYTRYPYKKPGRPRHTWLCTLEADPQPLNLGLNSAWKYTQDREHWKHLVETATLQLGACSWWWWRYKNVWTDMVVTVSKLVSKNDYSVQSN